MNLVSMVYFFPSKRPSPKTVFYDAERVNKYKYRRRDETITLRTRSTTEKY